MDIPYTVEVRPDTGLYNAKLGIWLFLASEVMLFGALFSAYILLRVGAPEGYWPHGWLNVPLGTANTLVLITSSITTVLAWAALKEKNFGKFKFFHAITLLCALMFLGIKSFEYRDKLMHYEITLKDGRIVDGHKVEETKDEITLSGYYVKDQEELFEAAREIEARRAGVYRLSDDERAAIERGLDDMHEGRFASEEAIAAIYRKARATRT